ncbi:MAG: sugar phosphate isomerase/epimerase [Bacteroidetes bacterium]|nr:sugar phosphate isomerase/epimerase [Bacteroidota bacterium]
MKIGMNLLLWTTDINEDLYPILEKIKAAGYDGVEVPIGDTGTDRYQKLGKKLKELELDCTAVTSVFEAENPASSDPKVRARAVDQMKWRMDMGKELGVEVIGGPFHSAFAYFSGEPPREDERKWSTEVMRKAAEYAETVDIVLTPEALNRFECYLYNTLDDISVLIKDVDHPNLRMIFDSHHAHIEEKNSADSIRKHASLIGHVHISESDRGTPGSGQVRWDDVFQSLREIGYDNWLTIEAFSRNKAEFASGINVWRNFEPTLDEIYQDGYTFIKEMWEIYG